MDFSQLSRKERSMTSLDSGRNWLLRAQVALGATERGCKAGSRLLKAACFLSIITECSQALRLTWKWVNKVNKAKRDTETLSWCHPTWWMSPEWPTTGTFRWAWVTHVCCSKSTALLFSGVRKDVPWMITKMFPLVFSLASCPSSWGCFWVSTWRPLM